jgi:tetratricopeptide repeat protein 21B
MSKDLKPQIYYLARRGWHDQLLKLCDNSIAKKGKDPITIYWKAYALGMTGNIKECLQQLEIFQSRRDLQFPVSLAMLYFQNKSPVIDHEAVDSLSSELTLAEDVTVRHIN